jgi:hypothetical protein
MRLKAICVAASLALVFGAGAALAQTPQDPVVQEPVVRTPDLADPTPLTLHQFIISGLAGGNFGADVDEASFNFGGAFNYLYQGRAGFEFLADFNPNLNMARDVFGDTSINSYMFNGMLAAPMGWEGRWQPYISAGIGVMTLNLDADPGFDPLETDNSQFAGNVGVGIMGFADRVGFRADVRYLTGFGTDDETAPELRLDNFAYWRSNVGIAFRW